MASLAIVGLAISGLNSGIAHFAVVLRDRAKSDLKVPGDSVADLSFKDLMNRTLTAAVLGALASAAFAILGIMLSLCPRQLARQDTSYAVYGLLQFMLGIGLISLRSYVADGLYGHRPLFTRLSRDDEAPSYDIMHYGSFGEAVYGTLVVFVPIATFLARPNSARDRQVRFVDNAE